jgi:hypothetical protein
MFRLKAGAALLALVLLVAGWYAFRPERAFLDRFVSESAPAADAVLLASGEFAPVAHEGRGSARILRLSDGRRVLRFSAFATLDGPDVRVYLLGAASVRGDRQLAAAGYVDLGQLKGNIGDQNYEIPSGLDISRYAAVAVWCRRFGVNFTEARLHARVLVAQAP